MEWVRLVDQSETLYVKWVSLVDQSGTLCGMGESGGPIRDTVWN